MNHSLNTLLSTSLTTHNNNSFHDARYLETSELLFLENFISLKLTNLESFRSFKTYNLVMETKENVLTLCHINSILSLLLDNLPTGTQCMQHEMNFKGKEYR